MKNRFRVFTALGFMLAVVLLAAVPAWAQSVDDRIKALEKELTQLKEQQIELKREATAAEKALPDFAYRPGAGWSITAADQSWGFRFGHEFAYDMMFLEGNDARREGDAGLFGRRNRPQITYTRDRGFWEFAFELDVDGDETGNKSSLIQRACMRTRFDRLNPWLPQFQFGMDCSGAGSRFRSTELSLELPTLDRNNGFNTGSHTGFGLNWANIPIGSGHMQLIYYVPIHGMGRGDGLKDQSNKVDHNGVFTIYPFSQTKNKWLEGTGLSMFAWYGEIDDRGTFGTRDFEIRSQEGSTRVTLFTSPEAGDDGYHLFLAPSARIEVGPYGVSGVYGWERYYTSPNDPVRGTMKAGMFKIMNDLMLFSPKGFLTGEPDEAGTLGLHYAFERTWAECGFSGVADCNQASGGGGRRIRLIVNEVGLKYWFRPSISLHLAYKRYDSSNTPTPAQLATNCSRKPASDTGKSCTWNDVVLRFYFIF